MAKKLAIETLTLESDSGQSVIDLALKGSKDAQAKVIEVFPELGVKPPAGLTQMEWAALGLQSARETLTQLLTAE